MDYRRLMLGAWSYAVLERQKKVPERPELLWLSDDKRAAIQEEINFENTRRSMEQLRSMMAADKRNPNRTIMRRDEPRGDQ